MCVSVCVRACIYASLYQLTCSSSSPQVNLGDVPLLCACDHPNLVRVRGFIRHGPTQRVFLVSQFVEGRSLAALLVSAKGGRYACTPCMSTYMCAGCNMKFVAFLNVSLPLSLCPSPPCSSPSLPLPLPALSLPFF